MTGNDIRGLAAVLANGTDEEIQQVVTEVVASFFDLLSDIQFRLQNLDERDVQRLGSGGKL